LKASKFLSNYLRKEEIEGEVPLTIASAAEEEVGFGENKSLKLVVYFKEIEKGLVVGSKAVLNMLIDAFSDETDKWVGEAVTIYVDPTVTYMGKRIGGIRVKVS
jgi:hypothetical protein